jgi:hypothetical protein
MLTLLVHNEGVGLVGLLCRPKHRHRPAHEPKVGLPEETHIANDFEFLLDTSRFELAHPKNSVTLSLPSPHTHLHPHRNFSVFQPPQKPLPSSSKPLLKSSWLSASFPLETYLSLLVCAIRFPPAWSSIIETCIPLPSADHPHFLRNEITRLKSHHGLSRWWRPRSRLLQL